MDKKKFFTLSIISLIFFIIVERLAVARGQMFLVPFIFLIPIPYVVLELREGTGFASALSLFLQGIIMLVFEDYFFFASIACLGIFTLIMVRLKKQGAANLDTVFISSLVFIILLSFFFHISGLPEISKSQDLQNALGDEILNNIDREVFVKSGINPNEFISMLHLSFKLFISLLPSIIISISFAVSTLIFFSSLAILRKREPGNLFYYGKFSNFGFPLNFGGRIGLMIIFAFILSMLGLDIADFFARNLAYLGYLAFVLEGIATVCFLTETRIVILAVVACLTIFVPVFSFIMFILGMVDRLFNVRLRISIKRDR